MAATNIEQFIARWASSEGSERANYQMFLSELCDVLEVHRPSVSSTEDGDYVFERNVYEKFTDGTSAVRRIDLYRKGCFVLEAKQGVEKQADEEDADREKHGRKIRKKKGHGVRGTKTWDINMLRAKEQAEAYVRFLPAEEGRPPFVLVVDVGHVIEVYAEFTRTGGTYLPFPTPLQHRIQLADLRDPEKRRLLKNIWEKPLELDPSIRAAQATQAVAAKLAELSRSLEAEKDTRGLAKYTPERVSRFLMRLIFTMFAEDMDLIPKGKFRQALEGLRGDAASFVGDIGELWDKMARGGRSVLLRAEIKHFNGGLFEEAEVLPINDEQLELLIDAASRDWSEVEPSIFGTLVERALDPQVRHKLGAHYTPRAYVERLVNQVVIEPLRDDWRGVLVEVKKELDSVKEDADDRDQRKAREEAVKRVEEFLAQLQTIKVLDPACGTGNFLYVSMELLKRLETEVQGYLEGLGGQVPIHEINPENFEGIELNPRAAEVASLVLWIGYLQIYARSHTRRFPREPILTNFHNIRNTDAILSFAATKPNIDKQGNAVTRWDGSTYLTDPATGRDVPDASARVADTVPVNPTETIWRSADFIVGNPPFLGKGEAMREALGDGYVQALRRIYKGSKGVPGVPDSADFVMYWWHKAVAQFSLPRLRRFGFVTTNSIKQTFNRRVIEEHMKVAVEKAKPLSLVYALPDHPWVDETDGADVRIAMTVIARGQQEGILEYVVKEEPLKEGEATVTLARTTGRINADLTVGADVTRAVPLQAMDRISSNGVMLAGSGFIVTRDKAAELGLGRIPGLEHHIREYRNGRDLTGRPRHVMVIDLFGLTEQQVRAKFPEVYQHLRQHVKPERDVNNRARLKENWWIFAEARRTFRPALEGLPRFIATVETSKHRFFQFLDISVLPDHMLIGIGHEDAYVLGVLSSRPHVLWALAQGGRLGVGNDPRYNKSRCFETFPFPETTLEIEHAIQAKAEELDAHRKRQSALHEELTMTGMYNVLEKLRRGEELSAKEKQIHIDGLVGTLRQLHDELDELVTSAYGWPEQLSDQEILLRLTELNATRALEEKHGHIRFIRRPYQDPKGSAVQDLGMGIAAAAKVKEKAPDFKERIKDQSQQIREVLRIAQRPLTIRQVARSFTGARVDRVEEVLEHLVALGQVREMPGGERYAA